METVTINLEGLKELMQIGPAGYVIALAMVTAICGIISWRQISAAGHCYGCSYKGEGEGKESSESFKQRMKGDSHVARAIVSGIIALAQLIIVLSMTYVLFQKSFAEISQ